MKNAAFVISLGIDSGLYQGYFQEDSSRLEPVCPSAGFFQSLLVERKKNPTHKKCTRLVRVMLYICIKV